MKETKEIAINLPMMILLQICLLVMYYGFNIVMPWWLIWMPFLIIGVIILFVIFLLIIVFIKELLK